MSFRMGFVEGEKFRIGDREFSITCESVTLTSDGGAGIPVSGTFIEVASDVRVRVGTPAWPGMLMLEFDGPREVVIRRLARENI